MALTLEEIMGTPTDPEELNKHLQARGLIAPPPVPAPVTVAPMSPVAAPPSDVHPMNPPEATGRNRELMLGATAQPVMPMKKPETLDAAPDMSGGMPTAGASPDLVKPMTPPKAPTMQESLQAGMEQHGDSAKEEAARQLKELRPTTDGLVPNSKEFWNAKIAQGEYDKANPWGSELNHPGLLGKIGHVAAAIGQGVGNAINPQIVAAIPGSNTNRALHEQEAVKQSGAAEERETQAKNEESESALRAAQTKRSQAQLEKENTEQSLEKDTEGNITGWKDGKGTLHSLDEEGTPQSIKDIAGATQNKPHFEKGQNGDIVQITPGKNGEAAKSEVLYKGQPNQKTETRQIVGPDGHAHDQVIDVTPGSATFGKSLADLGRSKEDKQPSLANEFAKAKAGEEVVLAYDKDNKAHLMSKADAEEEGMQHITKAASGDIDKAKTHHVVLNTLQTQLNSVVNASKALDQGIVQRGIIASALSHATDSTIDSAMRAAVLAGATEQTKDYVQSVIALREAGLALPKEITGGSRVSEVQASALWHTMPSAASLNSKYALKQATKFQQDIDRLRERAPQVRGQSIVDPDDAIKVKTKEKQHTVNAPAGGGANQQPPGPPAEGMEWRRNKKTGEFKQFPMGQ